MIFSPFVPPPYAAVISKPMPKQYHAPFIQLCLQTKRVHLHFVNCPFLASLLWAGRKSHDFRFLWKYFHQCSITCGLSTPIINLSNASARQLHLFGNSIWLFLTLSLTRLLGVYKLLWDAYALFFIEHNCTVEFAVAIISCRIILRWLSALVVKLAFMSRSAEWAGLRRGLNNSSWASLDGYT